MPTYSLSATMLGGQQLRDALVHVDSFAKQALADALNKAANDVHQTAVEKAPHKSGKLWNSIHSQYATSSNLVAKVGTNVVYAKAQEFGTVGMLIHSHSRTGKAFTYTGNIKPKLYMKQAFDSVKPKLTEYLRTAASQILSRITGVM